MCRLLSGRQFSAFIRPGLLSVALAGTLVVLPGLASGASSPHGTVAAKSTPPVQITIVDTITGRTNRGSIGTFTASGLVCPSGSWADVEATIGIITEHTCSDGSGAFDSDLRARMIFESGTGSYASLRGAGVCSLTTRPDGTGIRTCQLLAAFDGVAPSAAVTRFSVMPTGRKSVYRVHTSFIAHDDVLGNAVRFKLRLQAGSHTLVAKKGTTAGEVASYVLTARAPKTARALTLTLTLVDPIGNTRTLRRTKHLPHARR